MIAYLFLFFNPSFEKNMFYIYVIKSSKNANLYISLADNLKRRIRNFLIFFKRGTNPQEGVFQILFCFKNGKFIRALWIKAVPRSLIGDIIKTAVN